MKTAVIYARVSSTSDRQNTDRQVADLRAYAQREGLEIVKEFTEKMSGAKEDRPVLTECVAFCKENCTSLLVSEISRLGRSVKIIVNTIDELTKAGVCVHILDLRLKTLTPEGEEDVVAKMMLTVLGLGAEIERKNIVSRLNSGRELAKSKGVRMGRPEGSGMTDREFLDKHKEIVKRLREGQSMRDTAKLCDVSLSTVQRVAKAMKKSS